MKITRRKMFKAGAGLFLSQMMWNARDAWGQSSSSNYYALHIGVNDVDYDKYSQSGIRLSPLAGCIADALTYSGLIEKESGFKRQVLTNESATARNVYTHIVWAADKLKPGDLFVVTFAGHGSYIPDKSKPGDESDRQDETLCLYDRMLLDDELALMWGQFKPGVRILFISDSCHSGSVARAADAARGLADGFEDVRNGTEIESIFGKDISDPEIRKSITTARGLGVESTRSAAPNRGTAVRGSENIVPLIRSPSDAEATEAYEAQKDLYDSINASVRVGDSKSNYLIQASGLLLGAAQDWQFAQEVGGNGLFTKSVEKHADAGAASYQDLLSDAKQSVLKLTRNKQEPNFFPFGQEDTSFQAQAPFTKKAPEA